MVPIVPSFLNTTPTLLWTTFMLLSFISHLHSTHDVSSITHSFINFLDFRCRHITIQHCKTSPSCCFSLWLLLITVPWWPHYGNILVLIYGLRSCQDHEITIQSSYCCRASNLCTMVIVAYKKSSNSNYFHNCAFLHIMLRLHNFVFPYRFSAIY